MFSTTFLGHQGWVFQSGRACVLVDPLLREEFGHIHALGYRVYPPRVLVPESFPKVDAVVLTHEHDDHFDLPSLALLDRRIPILLSARSSVAAYTILCEMGFTVQPLLPGVAVTCGDLEILPLCGDHANTYTSDEWDTLPFLVRQVAGDGSFFSTVDVPLTRGHLEVARERAGRPGICGWTNNALNWAHVATFLPDRGDATGHATQRMRAGHQLIADVWGAPRAMLICAGGFTFQGARAWLNHRVFCVDTERVASAMAAEFPGERFDAARPGQTFHMEGNVLVRVDQRAPFLSTAPDGWPSRARDPAQEVQDYAPATGRRELEKKELGRLRQRLSEFAGALMGGVVFKGLYSLMGVEAEGRMSTFALVLRGGPQPLVFEYNPNSCSFDPGRPEDPRRLYLAGMECWGPDLLAVLSGEMGPIALAFGRSLFWNAMPQRFNFDLLGELYRFSHPLRRPAEYLRIYERQWRSLGAVKPAFLAR